MYNADSIGKRIRVLRKQQSISQEKMADDLNMYQADISNLEHAMSGSGITDLCKIDMIAEYFCVSLVEILTGLKLPDPFDSDKIEPEEIKMMDCVISDVKYGSYDETYFSELKLTAPDGRSEYISYSVCLGESYFEKNAKSTYEKMLHLDFTDEELAELEKNRFLSATSYIELFEKMEPDWLQVCRYLIFVATEDEESVKELISKTEGKRVSEIEVPIPEVEPEDLFNVDYSDLSDVYRFRLMLETAIKNPSVYDEFEDTIEREKSMLRKLRAACASEEAYKVWKKDLIDAKAKEIAEKQNLIVCTYMFAGIGQYKEIMPEEMLDSFKCWIQHNGSAFYGGERKATKADIRKYAAMHIADELLDDKASDI